MTIIRHGLFAVVAICALALFPRELVAHAIVIEASPEAQSIQDAGVIRIHLVFNSRLDIKRSRLTLIGDDLSLPIPINSIGQLNLVTGEIEDVPAGAYRLRWEVLSVDGHITRGDIPFRVE